LALIVKILVEIAISAAADMLYFVKIDTVAEPITSHPISKFKYLFHYKI
jgi:hypothetical protein